MVYSSFETGSILYSLSEDTGNTWYRPVTINGDGRKQGEYAIWPRLAVDSRGVVHLVWTTLPFPGRTVMYSQSSDGRHEWRDPTAIDEAGFGYASADYGPIYVDVEEEPFKI